MAHTAGEWADVLSITVANSWRSYPISEIAFDSRRITFPQQTLFIALRSANNDGHEYLQQAYDTGVRVFLVKQDTLLPQLPEACLMQVEDPLRSLQRMAQYHRLQFDYPVVGITGSNGKTIVKEWLYQLLMEDHIIVRTPKSYNSQIGVPLSVWAMAGFHDWALFEAGISEPGEMEHLAAIIQPDIGIFTTLGPAHDEGFSNPKQKVQEKLKLFTNVNALVYCLDHTLIAEGVKDRLPTTVQRLTWGEDVKADLRVQASQIHETHSALTLLWKGSKQLLDVPFVDRASIENALHCIRLLLHLGYDWPTIQNRLRLLHHIPMRLELKQAQQNSLLIYDCYNSDVKSLDIALDFLERHHSGRKKVVILSDIAQSGIPASTLYAKIGQKLAERGIEHLIGVGPDLAKSTNSWPSSNVRFFPDTESLLQELPTLPLQDAAILLKGARHFAFERVGEQLEQKRHATVFEINLNALADNLKQYQKVVPADVKTMAMVKAFSYGAGSFEIASVLAYHQVDYLAVAYTEEGIALRKANVKLPILVLNPDRNHLHQLWQYDLEPEVYSLDLLCELIHQSKGRPTNIHLMWDTGMHRLGMVEQDLPAVQELLQQHKTLSVVSQLSHLVGSDNPKHDDFTHSQAQLFMSYANQIDRVLNYRPLRHLLNSAGIVRFPEYAFDMVRLGLGLYGLDTASSIQTKLQPIGRLKTVISQIRTIPAGESVGYDRAVKVDRDTRLATVAIGYADGYRRSFSQGVGHMLVRGQTAPTLGNVCMDLTMLDVTDIPQASVGDEVVVFGPELPVEELAKQAQTIPYEIIAAIDQRVKRVYIEE